MSEQKDPNEINFDDEFLDMDFGDDALANPNGGNANFNDTDFEDLDAIFNQTAPAPAQVDVNNITLNDVSLNANDVAQMGADNLSDDDFFNQLDSLNQAHLTNTPPTTEPASTDAGISGAEAAAIGAAVTALGAAAASGDDGKKVASKNDKKGFSFGGLFGKKDGKPKEPKAPKTSKFSRPAKTPKAPKAPKPEKAPKAPKPAGAKKDLSGLMADPKKLNKLILAGVLALVLLGLALYMFMGQEEAPPPPPPAKPAPTKPAPPPAPKPADNTAMAGQGQQQGQQAQAQAQGQNANAQNANAQANAKTTNNQPAPKGGEVLPNIKPVVSPEEILNAPTPSDPALIKEEIDRLNDKGTQIAEQEKIIKEQLVLMEDLTTAKAEQIALLEKQIAELEKKKVATTTTPAPATDKK